LLSKAASLALKLVGEQQVSRELQRRGLLFSTLEDRLAAKIKYGIVFTDW
jgi:hypothetical protein